MKCFCVCCGNQLLKEANRLEATLYNKYPKNVGNNLQMWLDNVSVQYCSFLLVASELVGLSSVFPFKKDFKDL